MERRAPSGPPGLPTNISPAALAAALQQYQHTLLCSGVLQQQQLGHPFTPGLPPGAVPSMLPGQATTAAAIPAAGTSSCLHVPPAAMAAAALLGHVNPSGGGVDNDDDDDPLTSDQRNDQGEQHALKPDSRSQVWGNDADSIALIDKLHCTAVMNMRKANKKETEVNDHLITALAGSLTFTPTRQQIKNRLEVIKKAFSKILAEDREAQGGTGNGGYDTDQVWRKTPKRHSISKAVFECWFSYNKDNVVVNMETVIDTSAPPGSATAGAPFGKAAMAGRSSSTSKTSKTGGSIKTPSSAPRPATTSDSGKKRMRFDEALDVEVLVDSDEEDADDLKGTTGKRSSKATETEAMMRQVMAMQREAAQEAAAARKQQAEEARARQEAMQERTKAHQEGVAAMLGVMNSFMGQLVAAIREQK